MVAQFEHRFANSRSPLIPLNRRSPDDRRSAMNIRVFRPSCNTEARCGRTNAAAGNERVAPSIDLSLTARAAHGGAAVSRARRRPALIARACSAGPCRHAGAGRSGGFWSPNWSTAPLTASPDRSGPNSKACKARVGTHKNAGSICIWRGTDIRNCQQPACFLPDWDVCGASPNNPGRSSTNPISIL